MTDATDRLVEAAREVIQARKVETQELAIDLPTRCLEAKRRIAELEAEVGRLKHIIVQQSCPGTEGAKA